MDLSRREFLHLSAVNILLSSKRNSTPKVKKPLHNSRNSTKEELGVTKLCIVYNSGEVLLSENEMRVRPPASLVKLMLMYLISMKVEKKEIFPTIAIKPQKTIFPTNNSDFVISAQSEYLLNDLLKAMAVISSNTSAIAVAEALWGSVEKCVEEMNTTAKNLGMKSTRFETVNGYPVRPGFDVDRTTGRDMGIIAVECCKSPTILQWTSTKEFVIPGTNIVRKNTNDLLFEFYGCDGLKTGFTRSAGHCLIATAKRANKRIISVVMGAKTSRERFTIAKNLLEIGFADG